MSANEYYAEKMRLLLEMQQKGTNSPVTKKLPQSTQGTGGAPKGGTAGRSYYDSFRTGTASRQGQAASRPSGQASRVHNANGAVRPRQSAPGRAQPQGKMPEDRSPRSGRPSVNGAPQQRRSTAQAKNENDRRRYYPPKADATGADGRNARPRRSPEQTVDDKRGEEERRLEALKKARRGRRMRKLRDGLISLVLILAVFSVMCIVVYRLLFVIKDISAEGGESYTGDEIVIASGVEAGDHLYSFSSRIIGEKIMLNCPRISAVDVNRSAPDSITFVVTEDTPVYYAEFFGEIRALSAELRVLNSVSADEAASAGLVKLKLPVASEAVAGRKLGFASLRNDSFIYSVLADLADSSMADRIKTVDLRNQYDVKMNCDGRFLLFCGDSDKLTTKLRIAEAVLNDKETFSAESKAKIDISDLSETSVIIDNSLVLD